MSALQLQTALDHYQSLCKTCLNIEDNPSNKTEFIFDIQIDPESPLISNMLPQVNKFGDVENEEIHGNTEARRSKAEFDHMNDINTIKGQTTKQRRYSKKQIKKSGYFIPTLFITILLLVLGLFGYVIFDMFFDNSVNTSVQLAPVSNSERIQQVDVSRNKMSDTSINKPH